MAWISFWLGLAAVVVAAGVAQRSYYALQYFYFLRYPILLGLVLALLPIGTCDFTGRPIENLFVLEPAGLFVTSAAALCVAFVVQYTWGLLWTHLPARNRLPIRKPPAAAEERAPVLEPNGLGPLRGLGPRLACFSLLGLPLLVTSVVRSAAEGSVASRPVGALIAFGGWLAVLALVGLALLVLRTAGRLPPRVGRWLVAPFDLLARLPERIDRHVFLGEAAGPTGYEYQPGAAFNHRSAVFFLVATLTLYTVGWWALHPDRSYADDVGALVYVLLLLLLLGWLLPLSSFEFDKYRVPPEGVIVLVVALLYSLFGTDHFYRVTPQACMEVDEAGERVTRRRYVEAWQAARPRPPMVVVAASGGGITAAYWTAAVLTSLHEAVPGFGDGVALVSSTSGGSVGAMYYVHGFDAEGPPVKPGELSAIRRSAGETSLAALLWGLVYPDILRIALPVSTRDRGWALETRWEQRLGASPPTLGGWKEDAGAGWRPAVIFNATLVESGQRFLLSSLDLGDERAPGDAERVRGRSFDALYPGNDARVATAARLSATFPWVTPVARPDLPNGCCHLYHVADGGYYDNFGVMSAVEFLEDVIDETYPHDRVLLLEIRASDTSRVAPPRLDAGFRLEAIGPADTMLAVRSASQLARNDLDTDLIRKVLSSRGVALARGAFELRADVPLSWHLSVPDKRKICEALGAQDAAFAKVAAFFGRARAADAAALATACAADLDRAAAGAAAGR